MMWMAPLYGGWLVFFMMSAVLVPQPVGRWCRALSFGLLFGPALGVGCGLGLIPAWLGLLFFLQSGLELADRLFLGGLALAGAGFATLLYLVSAQAVRSLWR